MRCLLASWVWVGVLIKYDMASGRGPKPFQTMELDKSFHRPSSKHHTTKPGGAEWLKLSQLAPLPLRQPHADTKTTAAPLPTQGGCRSSRTKGPCWVFGATWWNKKRGELWPFGQEGVEEQDLVFGLAFV